MKYSALFGLAALALGFVACDEIEESTGLPQTNPQLPILTVDNVPLTPAAAAQQGINLIQANDNGGTINLATIETPADFPEGYRAEVLSIELGRRRFHREADYSGCDRCRGQCECPGR